MTRFRGYKLDDIEVAINAIDSGDCLTFTYNDDQGSVGVLYRPHMQSYGINGYISLYEDKSKDTCYISGIPKGIIGIKDIKAISNIINTFYEYVEAIFDLENIINIFSTDNYGFYDDTSTSININTPIDGEDMEYEDDISGLL